MAQQVKGTCHQACQPTQVPFLGLRGGKRQPAPKSHLLTYTRTQKCISFLILKKFRVARTKYSDCSTCEFSRQKSGYWNGQRPLQGQRMREEKLNFDSQMSKVLVLAVGFSDNDLPGQWLVSSCLGVWTLLPNKTVLSDTWQVAGYLSPALTRFKSLWESTVVWVLLTLPLGCLPSMEFWPHFVSLCWAIDNSLRKGQVLTFFPFFFKWRTKM